MSGSGSEREGERDSKFYVHCDSETEFEFTSEKCRIHLFTIISFEVAESHSSSSLTSLCIQIQSRLLFYEIFDFTFNVLLLCRFHSIFLTILTLRTVRGFVGASSAFCRKITIKSTKAFSMYLYDFLSFRFRKLNKSSSINSQSTFLCCFV